MKRILLISAMSAASVAAIAAGLSNRDDEKVIVVILGGEDSAALKQEFALPILKACDYIAIETGEVIPDFIPAKVEIPASPDKGEVFHPPKLAIHLFDKPSSRLC